MKKVIYCTITTIACMAVCGGEAVFAQTPTADPGVEIEGVVWATRNVAEKGRFTDNPEDYGGYFTYNDVQKACPDGWRVPTKDELFTLINIDSEWTSVNNVNGRRFGTGDATIFLPAAGLKGENDPPVFQGMSGHYGSTTPPDNSGTEHCIGFSEMNIDTSSGGNSILTPLRCVRE